MPTPPTSDLLAITDGTEIDDFLRRARLIAQGLQSRLGILLTVPLPDAGACAPYGDPHALGAISHDINATASHARDRIDALLAPSGISTRLFAAPPNDLLLSVTHAARHADLVLFPTDAACGNLALRDALMSAVLDGAACPVLVVRGRDPVLPSKRTLLAWNGSRACSRAWRDAIRLVSPGTHVDLVIGAIAAASRVNGVERAEIALEHVRNQGFEVQCHRVSIHPLDEGWRPPAERLIELERTFQADLVVMGAGSTKDPDMQGLSELTVDIIRNGEANLLLAR